MQSKRTIKSKRGKIEVTYYITERGYQKLYEDYLNVDNEIIKVNKMMGESVKRDNDLRENPEFMDLRVKAMYTLPAKKKSMWEKYNTATVIEETEEYKNFDGNTVIRGSSVRIYIDEENEKYQIKGSDEGDIKNNILSCDAPMAQALLGKHVGDKIEFNGMIIEINSVEKI